MSEVVQAFNYLVKNRLLLAEDGKKLKEEAAQSNIGKSPYIAGFES